MKIASVIITRNEAENLENCVASLNFSDEIIVIDNGSTDDTINIAKSLGAKTYQIYGLDFSYIRNVGKEKATAEWLFYVDCDEKVSEELSKEITETVAKTTQYAAYSIVRKNYFYSKEWPKTERMIRLIKKDALIGWQGSLHETPIIAGNVGQLHSFLLHFTHNDLTSMVKKTNEWSEIEAQLRFKSNHPVMSWWRFFRVMSSAFWKSYITDMGWKAGTTGIIESIYQSFSMFITYAKLWEKQNKSVFRYDE